MFKKLFRTFAVFLFLSGSFLGKAISNELTFFTIGTGGTAYTYYPVGGMIANAISKPPGSRECGKGGSCGVDGLIASAVSSRGSVDNVNAIISGLRNSGFALSVVAYWAYTGPGTMEGKEPAKDLRTIAALFQEHIHLVALKKSNINSVKDLKGKAATDALRNGKVDAIFVVAGYPTGAIVELASAVDIKLVPIDGAGAKALTSKYGFFSESPIPSGTYEGVDAVNTVAVGAQWFTSAKEDTDLIYKITKALWNKESRKLMDVGHAKGKTITPDTALSGVGVPLHPGAEKFYKEAGLIK